MISVSAPHPRAQGGARQLAAHHHFVEVPGSFCARVPGSFVYLRQASWYFWAPCDAGGAFHVNASCLAGARAEDRRSRGSGVPWLLGHAGFHFLPLASLPAALPADPSPLCHPMCEAHMVQSNCCVWEHAPACPGFIRRIKEWNRGENFLK